MTNDDAFQMPAKPFFSCDADCFAIVDGERLGTAAQALAAEPILKLDVGAGNVFERRPLRVTAHDARYVEVQCDGDETVRLDIREFTAGKTTPDGEFLYRGGLEDANDGLGFIRAR